MDWYVLIKKDKTIWYKEYGKPLVEVDLSAYLTLNVPCQFEEGYTVNDLFDLIETNNRLLHMVDFFSTFNEERNIEEQLDNKLDEVLEFYWHSDIIDEEPFINRTRMDLHSIQEGKHYSISFVPVNKLANLQLKINPDIVKWEEGNSTVIGESHPSLIHILNGLFYELTFYGLPEQRDKEFEDLQNAVNSITAEECLPLRLLKETITQKYEGKLNEI